MKKNKNISIKDIAKISGFSVATVSRVLNGKAGKYSAATENKIKEIVKEEGYSTNLMAKSLRESKSFTIGLIIPNINNDFYSSIALYIENYFSQFGYFVYICNSGEDGQKELDYFTSLDNKFVDGIICSSVTPNLPDDLLKRDIPIVLFDRINYNIGKFYTVRSNEADGINLSTQHLINLGCKKLVFLSNSPIDNDNEVVDERLVGFIETLEKNNFKDNQAIIIKRDYKTPFHIGSEIAINDLISKKINFDGVVASSDLAALGVIHALKSANIKVPEEVKVTGFDNSLYSQISSPPISTISRHPNQIAKTTCEIMHKLISGEIIEDKEVIIPVNFIIRESSS